MKKLLFILFISIYVNAVNPISLQYMEIDVVHTYLDGKKENYKISVSH